MKAGLAAVLVVLAVVPATASAHVRASAGYSDIRLRDGGVRYELSLESSVLDAASGHGAPEAYVLPLVRVYVDGVACEGEQEATGRERRDGRDYTTLLLGFECPGSPEGGYEIDYGVFAGVGVVDDHTNLARYDLGRGSGAFVFDAAHTTLRAGSTGLIDSVARFSVLGVEHILSGLDHVLFLVALLLGAGRLGAIVRLATAFTAAHSVTLALGALGWVQVPGEIVEPLIALSIAYVAAENLLGGASRHRLAVVFGFGLLHGLGFAGSLSWSGDLDVGALVSFNAGIEIGQALLVAAVFPLLLLVRRFRWSPVAHAGAGAGAAALGLVWFFERLMA